MDIGMLLRFIGGLACSAIAGFLAAHVGAGHVLRPFRLAKPVFYSQARWFVVYFPLAASAIVAVVLMPHWSLWICPILALFFGHRRGVRLGFRQAAWAMTLSMIDFAHGNLDEAYERGYHAAYCQITGKRHAWEPPADTRTSYHRMKEEFRPYVYSRIRRTT